MTYEEKIKKIAKLTREELLNAYDYYNNHWNPIDHDMAESRDLVREEILWRMLKGEEDEE